MARPDDLKNKKTNPQRKSRRRSKKIAAVASGGLECGAAVVDTYNIIEPNETDLLTLAEAIKKTATDIASGDMSKAEEMLFGQAVALQSIFVNLAKRVTIQGSVANYKIFMDLTLKAQNQSRATLATLTDLKYPRQVSFMKQNNYAAGAQQVNNGVSSESREPAREEDSIMKSKLSPLPRLENTGDERQPLDFGTTAKTGRTDPELVPVEAVHRTKDRSR